MRTITKALKRTPKHLGLELRAEDLAMPSPHKKRKRPLTTSKVRAVLAYPLEDSWVDHGDVPFSPTAAYPIQLRHRERQDPLALSPSETALWITAFGWPLTADKSRRLLDAEVEERVERYRSTLTGKDVTNLLVARVGFARAYARENAKKPLANQSLLILEAEDAAVSAMTGAYRRQSRERVAQSKKGGVKSAEKRQGKAIKWKNPARKLLREAERKDEINRVRRSAGALAKNFWVILKQMKRIRVPKEETIQDFIQKERKSKTFEIGGIKPA